MRALLAFLLAAAGLSGTASYAGPWQRALPGWEFTFPGDHYSHPAFRTEWWYVTGSIRAADGREFGYQFTIFRRGILPPEERGRTTSRFVVNDLALGHFTLTDVSGARFYHDQKMSRGAWGDAGFGDVESGRPAWIGGCGIRCHPAGGFSIISQPGSAITLKLDLVPERPVVIHGENGVSRKAAGEGNASHYYSITRMKSTGTLELKGETLNVSGTSWLDREWATNQLAADQAGWDWFSLHLDDGSDLMLYQMRRRDGSIDPFSSGTWMDPSGKAFPLTVSDYTLTPLKTWTSSVSGGKYPVEWRVVIPSRKLDLTVAPVMEAQELQLKPVTYWEGLVRAAGSHKAVGYMELTGYAGPLTPLSLTTPESK